MDSDQCADDLHSQVLLGTLDEITSRQGQDSVDCCVICLESVSDVCEVIPCRHRNFDYLCLLSWLEHSPKCPLCKATITKVRHALEEPVAKVYVVPERPSQSSSPDSTAHYPTFRLEPRFPRRRHRREGPRPDTRHEPPSNVVAWRREIYRQNRYSKHVGSNRVSQYRELTPALFCADSELVSRARMWIRRELQVFSFLTLDESDTSIPRPSDTQASDVAIQRRANNAEFLLEYVIAVLKSVDIMGSGGQAEDMISDFLGRESTRLFLHELRAWLRSPYTKLEDWDRAVQYDDTAAITTRQEVPREDNAEEESAKRRRYEITRSSSSRGDYYRPRSNRVEKHRPILRLEPYGRRRRGSRYARNREQL